MNLKIFLTGGLLTASLTLFSQELLNMSGCDKYDLSSENLIAYSSSQTDREVYQAVEESPQFPGGQQGLMEWLSRNIKYPEAAQQNKIEGRVIVQFVVEKDGTITNAKIIRGVNRDLDTEALRVVNSMPKWLPGKNNGVPVASYFNLPVIFRLSD